MSIRKGTTIIAGNASSNEWTGTLEEYNIALENGTIKENMICYITDDILYAEDFKPELDNKANIDLSNLSPTGEARFASGLNNKITNCLLEVPQRIKLELANGVLTLKAGSIVTVPNGFEADGTTPKFDYVTVPNDVVAGTPYTNGDLFIYYYKNSNSISQANNSAQCSGASSSISNGYWYDTTNNSVKRVSNGAEAHTGESLPIGIINASNGSWSSINQVFNGFGYIGSSIWVDKGVKGLIPNGRNEDGSLRNIEFTTSKLIFSPTTPLPNGNWVAQISEAGYGVVFESNYFEQDTEPTGVTGWTVWFNTRENRCYLKEIGNSSSSWTQQDLCNNRCVVTASNGVITSINIKQPFRVVDYGDLTTTITAVDWSKKVDKTVSTTYTAECNGYVIAWGSPQGNNDLNCTINGQSVFNLNFHGLSGAGYAQGFTLPVAKGDTYSVVGANGQYYFLPFKEA